jgi:hypothetical protein
MPSIEKIKEKLGDYKVLLKHMDFLQNNGFSDYGRGHIVGQIELLEEYVNEARENEEEAQVVEMESDKETIVIADKRKGEEEGRSRGNDNSRRMVADITYEKGKITISKEDNNNRTANNNINYYNESNPDPGVRQRQQFIKAEYGKKLDANNNIINNNELPSQKEDQITQVSYSPSDNNNYNKPKIKEVQDLNREDNKVIKQSWRDRIKGMANNIEDWR